LASSADTSCPAATEEVIFPVARFRR
jgi:hypothetical protein